MRYVRHVSEAQLQRSILALLRVKARRGVMYLYIPNDLPTDPVTGKWFKLLGMKPGAADLLVIVDRQAHFLELKCKRGKQSHDQKLFQLEAELHGIPYRLAYSFEQAESILTEWSALPSSNVQRQAA